jgi:Phosphodiester glycosidase
MNYQVEMTEAPLARKWPGDQLLRRLRRSPAESRLEPHDAVRAASAESAQIDGSEAPKTPSKHPRFRKYGKRGLLVVAVLLIPVIYSYGRALAGPGNDSLQARSVEWAREHHLGGVVDRVEKYWYDHHQAKVGGAPSQAAAQLTISTGVPSPAAAPVSAATHPVSTVGVAAAPASTPAGALPVTPASSSPVASTASAPAAVTQPVTPANPPAALVSPSPNPVAQEGQWKGIGAAIDGHYGAYATLIRPDDVHTSVLDAVVWIDPAQLSFRQYPGQKIPGGPWDRPDYVEPARQPDLLAAFEGGFRLGDSRGGMFLGGRTLAPLKAGGATLTIDKNGVPNIGEWGRDFTSTDTLDSARQNLTLIVDNGAIEPQLATDPNHSWGFTGPANHDAVWRSGAGVTADGAFVWVGGNGLTIVTLAETLVRAGAVRGMQLDINHEWVQFNTYAADQSGTVHGSLLLNAMQHSGDRYLTEDTRDFFAVFRRPR